MNKETYEENWAVYFGNFGDDEIGSILVDLGLHDIAPIKSKNYLITITIFINSPDKDGFPTNEERELLNKLEDNLIEIFTSKHNAIYPGRITLGGKQYSLFYSENIEEIEHTISIFLSNNQSHRIEHKIAKEDNWEMYFDSLYPSPIEMQGIQNDLVVQNLEEHGDSLEKERPVDHWIYFESSSDREDFLKSIENEGFEIVVKEEISSDEYPFSLQLTRVDKVDYENVNTHTIFLWKLAQEFNGHYDGWETFVVKD